MSDTDDIRPPKGRSRSYPSLSLPDAIEKARVLWEFAKQHKVPVASITERWGYKSPTTGPATTSYAALKKYGLLIDEGSGSERRGSLTDLAVAALNKPDPAAALYHAALTPPIMREFWERFRADLPPVETLRWEYVVQDGAFTESGLNDFLRVYRANLPIIAAWHSVNVEDEEDPDGGGDEPIDKPDGDDPDRSPGKGRTHQRLNRKDGSAVVAITVPVPGFGADEPAVVEFPGKLSESEWTYVIAVLSAMKEGVLREPDEPVS